MDDSNTTKKIFALFLFSLLLVNIALAEEPVLEATKNPFTKIWDFFSNLFSNEETLQGDALQRGAPEQGDGGFATLYDRGSAPTCSCNVGEYCDSDIGACTYEGIGCTGNWVGGCTECRTTEDPIACEGYPRILVDITGPGCQCNCPLPYEQCSNDASLCAKPEGQSCTQDSHCCSGTCNNGQCAPVQTNQCGNGIIEQGEQCDDGNTQNGDGCTASCQTQQGWTCDGRNPTTCWRCGDGEINPGEQCDDGNTVGGDGCTIYCQEQPGWTCDNEEPTNCWRCGDGNINTGEQCDDGNTQNGDGCSSTCQIEQPQQCTGTAPTQQCTSSTGQAMCLRLTAECINGAWSFAGQTCAQDGVRVVSLCNDGNLCTTDTCSSTNICVNSPVTCNDNNACTDDSCNAATGQCVSTADDTNTCIDGTCSSGACVPDDEPCSNHPSCPNGATTFCSDSGTAVINCLDLNGDGCYEPSGGLPCSAGQVCEEGACVDGPVQAQCVTNADCSDGNACTTNICSEGQCVVGTVTCSCPDPSTITCGEPMGDECCDCGIGTYCEAGNECTENGCVPTQCEDDPRCADGEGAFCPNDGNSPNIYYCADLDQDGCLEVLDNQDPCPQGQVCTGGECKAPCEDNNDCQLGQQCTAGYCEGEPCQHECTPGLTCVSGTEYRECKFLPDGDSCLDLGPVLECDTGYICDETAGECVVAPNSCGNGEIDDREQCDLHIKPVILYAEGQELIRESVQHLGQGLYRATVPDLAYDPIYFDVDVVNKELTVWCGELDNPCREKTLTEQSGRLISPNIILSGITYNVEFVLPDFGGATCPADGYTGALLCESCQIVTDYCVAETTTCGNGQLDAGEACDYPVTEPLQLTVDGQEYSLQTTYEGVGIYTAVFIDDEGNIGEPGSIQQVTIDLITQIITVGDQEITDVDFSQGEIEGCLPYSSGCYISVYLQLPVYSEPTTCSTEGYTSGGYVGCNNNCELDTSACEGCTDNDGDGYSTEGGLCGAIDCNDNNPDINPGASETCDGQDNDCDGEADEEIPVDECPANGAVCGDGIISPSEQCEPGPLTFTILSEGIPSEGTLDAQGTSYTGRMDFNSPNGLVDLTVTVTYNENEQSLVALLQPYGTRRLPDTVLLGCSETTCSGFWEQETAQIEFMRPDFGNIDSCVDFGHKNGWLFCTPDCQINVDVCTGSPIGVCGDGILNEGEQCDVGPLLFKIPDQEILATLQQQENTFQGNFELIQNRIAEDYKVVIYPNTDEACIYSLDAQYFADPCETNRISLSQNGGEYSGVWNNQGTTYDFIFSGPAHEMLSCTDFDTFIGGDISCTNECTYDTTQCTPPPQDTPACSDGIDNDGDGLVDYGEDPGCAAPDDTDESDDSDYDGDGCVDSEDPFPIIWSDDTDGDGVADDCDNCVLTQNPEQTDSDNDGIGDACEDLLCEGVVMEELFTTNIPVDNVPTAPGIIKLKAYEDVVYFTSVEKEGNAIFNRFYRLESDGTYTRTDYSGFNEENDFLLFNNNIYLGAAGEITVLDARSLEELFKIPGTIVAGAYSDQSFSGITTDGESIYAISYGWKPRVYKFTPTGELIWKQENLFEEFEGHLEYQDGRLYATANNKVIAFDTQDGSIIWQSDITYPTREIGDLAVAGSVVSIIYRDRNNLEEPYYTFLEGFDKNTGLHRWILDLERYPQWDEIHVIENENGLSPLFVIPKGENGARAVYSESGSQVWIEPETQTSYRDFEVHTYGGLVLTSNFARDALTGEVVYDFGNFAHKMDVAGSTLYRVTVDNNIFSYRIGGLQVDSDQDGVPDSCDNCNEANANQEDYNRNGIGDLCEQLPPPVICEATGGEWQDDCGPSCVPTCDDQNPTCPAVCGPPGCECPEDRPYWDPEQGCIAICTNGYYCLDTDGGINFPEYGETYSNPINGRGPSFIHQDTCIDDQTLEEGYCQVNGLIGTETTTCAFGCVDGACQEFIPEGVCGDGIITPGEQCEPQELGLTFTDIQGATQDTTPSYDENSGLLEANMEQELIGFNNEELFIEIATQNYPYTITVYDGESSESEALDTLSSQVIYQETLDCSFGNCTATLDNNVSVLLVYDNFNELTCSDFDEFTGGILSCNPTTCQINVNQCTGGTEGVCGDGVINTGEQCDGTNWGPITSCADFGFAFGELSCFSTCSFDTTQCSNNDTNTTPPEPVCGDNVCDTTESCNTCSEDCGTCGGSGGGGGGGGGGIIISDDDNPDSGGDSCDQDLDGYYTSECAEPDDLLDCNDRNPFIHPFAWESCNGKDDDCDGIIDEDCSEPPVDSDGSGQEVEGGVSINADTRWDADALEINTYYVRVRNDGEEAEITVDLDLPGWEYDGAKTVTVGGGRGETVSFDIVVPPTPEGRATFDVMISGGDISGERTETVLVDVNHPFFTVKDLPKLGGYDEDDQIPVYLLVSDKREDLQVEINLNRGKRTLYLELVGVFDSEGFYLERFEYPADTLINRGVLIEGRLEERGREIATSTDSLTN